MRPAEYRDLLVDLFKNSSDVQRVEVVESGKHPFALVATVAGKEQRWQVIGQLADGAKHDVPTAPVNGGPPAFTAAAATGAPDVWLAGLIGGAEPVDVERLEVWSLREGKSSAGVTVFFHNGERAFVRLL